MAALLEQSKVMLAECSRLEEATEWRARANALATYTRQRDLGHDAELAATEIVRRCERRIGELIRKGQDDDTIAKPSRETGPQRVHNATPLPSPAEAAGVDHRSELVPIYAMTDDVSEEHFEDAITEAKDEGNLSRANLVRKTQAKAGKQQPPPSTAETPRNPTVAGGDRIRTMNLAVAEIVHTLEGASVGLDLIDYAVLDQAQIPGWIDSLTMSLSALNRMLETMKKPIL